MTTEQASQPRPVLVNDEEAACAASYHTLLYDGNLARRTHEDLASTQHALGIEVGGRILCSVLRPRFLSTPRERVLDDLSTKLAAILERAGEHFLQSDRLLDLIGASEQEREIWAVDPGYEGIALTSRLDSFMIGGEPRFIEYNAESPASVGFCDLLDQIFRRLPAMDRWPPAQSMRGYQTRQALLETLLWAYREHGENGTPSVAIVDWEHVLTRRDFELCADYLRAHGIPTIIADPRSLEYRNGALWSGDRRITLVYRRVLLHELLGKAGEAYGLLQAYRDGAVCMVNSPRSKLLHKKSVLALLSDGRLDSLLDSEDRRLVADTIPWTRLVEPIQTTYDGQTVDLGTFVIQERERLVLKPTDDYGGKGIVLGWETEPDVWEAAIEAAMDQLFVVQERVPTPQAEFPVWQDDHLATERLIVDTDPLLFRSRMRGILTRVSAAALLNVSAGTGSSTPTFVMPEEE